MTGTKLPDFDFQMGVKNRDSSGINVRRQAEKRTTTSRRIKIIHTENISNYSVNLKGQNPFNGEGETIPEK
jgi:hypothetical protein